MTPQSTVGETMVGATLASTYEILRIVAEGGMGTVYEAMHLRLNKHVAVKVMAHALVSNPEALARFRREAEVTSAIGHPHIVQVMDVAATPTGEPFFVMEFLDGEDLEHRMQRLGRLSSLLTLHIVKQVASALAAAHTKGVIHRDLKPANIFLLDAPGERDFVKVLDFGVSKVHAATTKLTAGARLMGTPRYMSREQAQGLADEVDERTDQWALACIAWEALAGRPPFVADDDLSVLYQVVYETPGPLQGTMLPPQSERVLRRALAKDRRERFSTITDFARAFERTIVGGASETAKAKRRHTHTGLTTGPRPLPTLRLASSTPGAAGRSPRRARRRLRRLTTVSDSPLAGKRSRAKWFWPIAAVVAAGVVVGASAFLQAVPPAPNADPTTVKTAPRRPVLAPEAISALPPWSPDAGRRVTAGETASPGLPHELEPGLHSLPELAATVPNLGRASAPPLPTKRAPARVRRTLPEPERSKANPGLLRKKLIREL